MNTFFESQHALTWRSTAMKVAKCGVVMACLVNGMGFAQVLTVKIGHVGPVTGAIAHLGKDNERGARLAVEDLNAKQIRIGGQAVRFELVAEDDAADPKQGAAAAQKLVDLAVSGVIGHLNSGTSIPASKIYSDAGIPQISPGATNPKLTRQGYKTTFRVVADDVQLGGTLGRYAVQTLHGKSFAVMDDRTAYGQGVADEFEKAVRAAGGQVIGREFTTDKSIDFMPILTVLKKKNPDVIFFGGMDAVAGPMLRQLRSLGIQAKFMGGDGMCTTELVKLAGDALGNGQVYCADAGGVERAYESGMEAFNARFKNRFHEEVKLYAPYAYDAVNVMVDAMVKSNSSLPARYLPTLAATTDFQGITGKISFDPRGDLKNGALTLYTFKEGARTRIAVVR